MDLKKRAQKLKTDIPAIFLALKDKDTPLPAKVFAGLTIAYSFSPVDLIPDFIPVLGYLDDVILFPALVSLTVKFIPEDVLKKSKRNAEGILSGWNAWKWYYMIPVVAVWGIIIGVLVL